MEHLSKLYTVDFFDDFAPNVNWEALLRIVKLASSEHSLQLEIFGKNKIQLTGATDKLAHAEAMIKRLVNSNEINNELHPNDDPSIGKLDDFLNNQIPAAGEETSQDQKNTAHTPNKNTLQTGTTNRAPALNPAKDNNQDNQDEALLLRQRGRSANNDTNIDTEENIDAVGAFEKPHLESQPFFDNTSITTSIGVLPETETDDRFANNRLDTQDLRHNTLTVTPREHNVIAPNIDPEAFQDTLTINQDASSANIYYAVLANDVDTDVLRITSVDTSGTSGSITFDPATYSLIYSTGNGFDALAVGQSTTDTFNYTIEDGRGGSDTTSVTVTINGINDTPTGITDSFSINENATSANMHTVFLSNDTDIDIGDTLDILSIDTTATIGNVTFDDATNSLTYNAANFDYLSVGTSALDSFIYTLTDNHGDTSNVTVTVTIDGLNAGPTANNDAFTTNEDTITLGNVLSDNGNGADSDIDTSDVLTVSAVSGVGANVGATITGSAGGLFTIDANGSITFDPNGEFESMDTSDTIDTTISYTISDGNGGTDTANVTVTVTGVNDAPIANDDPLYDEAAENNNTIIISEADLMANDTDIENDPLDITAMTPAPGDGSIVDNGDGTWTYTSPVDSLGFSGIATITYTLMDDGGLTDTATFQLRVFNTIIGTAGSEAIIYEDINTPHKFIDLAGDDTVTGSNKRDLFISGDGNDTLTGGSGDDDFIFDGTITGSDNIDGGSGTDRILGGTGDDTFSLSAFTNIEEIDMGTGTDTLLGTAGNDTYYFNNVTVTDLDIIDGNGGTDIISGTGSHDTINLSNVSSITGISHFDGGAGNDTIHASQDADTIRLSTGYDRLYGEGGDDIFTTSGAHTSGGEIYGGTGYDSIIGSAGNDTLILNSVSGIELIDLGAGTNYIQPSYDGTLNLSGASLLNVNYVTDNTGTDTIIGSVGNDEIHMQSDSRTDTFRGEAGDDSFIFSGSLNRSDHIYGGTGYDTITGSAGNDVLLLTTLSSIEFIDLGAGIDYMQSSYNGTLDLSGYTLGVDLLGLNYITDHTGTETVIGTAQNDEIHIQSDGRTDTLYGGDGADIFLINATKTTVDTLADFDVTEGDAIDISTVISYDSGLGDLISDFVRLTDPDSNPANGSGTVTMQIDVDGTANGVNFQNYFTFDDQSTQLLDMISGGNLIVE